MRKQEATIRIFLFQIKGIWFW